MRSKSILVVVLCVLLFCFASISFATTASFQGLGDLSGGNFYSNALAVSADGSAVVGYSNSASGYEAFRWTSGGGMVGLGDLPGGNSYSDAYDVSADGSVVVGSSVSDSGFEAFRWQAGVMTGLGSLPGGDSFYSRADGSIVVGTSQDAWGHEAFIWDAENGIRNLKDVLVNDFSLNLTAWTLWEARDISADGFTIVGWGNNPAGNNVAWIASIPEPTTLILLSIGSVMLRKRRQSSL